MQLSLKQQQGMTFISLVIVLSVIGFFIMLILKIGPIYMNHSKVTNAIAGVKQTTDIATKSKEEIYNLLQKRFDMNYVEYVTKEDIDIVAQRGYVKLEVEYERVEPIVGNLSVLVQFKDGFEIGDK